MSRTQDSYDKEFLDIMRGAGDSLGSRQLKDDNDFSYVSAFVDYVIAMFASSLVFVLLSIFGEVTYLRFFLLAGFPLFFSAARQYLMYRGRRDSSKVQESKRSGLSPLASRGTLSKIVREGKENK